MGSSALSVGRIVSTLAEVSRRPRYAFMVLNLISEVAGPDGKAGPFVKTASGAVALRDWLSDNLAPLAHDERRRADLRRRLMAAMKNELPDDPEEAERLVETAMRERIRASGKTNVSHAVSDLVRAGLVKRHYEGWVRNHVNRGAQRHAVYVIDGDVLAALRRGTQLL
ncbi:hypothetical protein [Pedomonas mirosovicensis]|uniref:hypothetical protein n=1 Tax=Pedomonas mirosovicensis TaxID=2908641 RepID=UPI002168F5CB|nr:hypothetical protein [Pedomonas mirosovicensis]MCH8686487.1 hypothetical protein [Pedomonas mirosovicensis]